MTRPHDSTRLRPSRFALWPIALGMAVTLLCWSFTGAHADDRNPSEGSDTNSSQPATREAENDNEDAPVVRIDIGLLSYAGGKTSRCFSAGFLAMLDRRTDLNVQRAFRPVPLDAGDLFDFPFLVMSGEADFTLTNAEVKRLREYLTRGGFLLASAGCSNRPWGASFKREIARVLPDARLSRVDAAHPMFHTVFEIDALSTRRASAQPPAIWTMSVGDRIAMLFSPEGLNDTANAGDGCCCCGGNELRDAHLFNANVLAWVLTH